MEKYINLYNPIKIIFLSHFYPLTEEVKLGYKQIKLEEQLITLHMGYAVYLLIDKLIIYLTISNLENIAEIGFSKFDKSDGVMWSAGKFGFPITNKTNAEVESRCKVEISEIQNLIIQNSKALSEHLAKNDLNSLIDY